MLDDPILQSIILGLLQGLTEFLPISSSGHLLILPWLFGWEPMGLTFDVMLHLGTLLAVLVHFRHDWMRMLRGALRMAPEGEASATPSLSLLAFSTLPAIVIGGLFHQWIEATVRGPLVVIINLVLFGLLLAWADRRGQGRVSLADIGPRQALWIGAAQLLALMPGVSRAGVTLAAARLQGLSRWDSARFSFLMGAPVIALASASRFWNLLSGAEEQAPWLPILVGAAVAFVCALACIRFFLGYIRTRGVMVFVVYRLVLAAVLSWAWWSSS